MLWRTACSHPVLPSCCLSRPLQFYLHLGCCGQPSGQLLSPPRGLPKSSNSPSINSSISEVSLELPTASALSLEIIRAKSGLNLSARACGRIAAPLHLSPVSRAELYFFSASPPPSSLPAPDLALLSVIHINSPPGPPQQGQGAHALLLLQPCWASPHPRTGASPWCG